MADYCLECFNRLNNTNYKVKRVTLEESLCEGCREIKPCVTFLYPQSPWNKALQALGRRSKD